MIKKNLFNISIGLIFIFILSSYLFLFPKYNELSASKDNLNQKIKNLEQKESYFLKLTDLAVRLDSLKDNLGKIETSLPDQLSEAGIINFLEKKSSENGLILESVSSSSSIDQKDNKIKNTKKISFHVELSGGYNSFKNFLLELYKSERIFELESINFTTPPQNSKDNLFKFKINIGVYYYTEQREEVQKKNTDEMMDIKSGIMP